MLAGGEQSRLETRQTTMLQAKMRDAQSTRSVRLGDLSPKGMLVVSDRPPSRGEFVDIIVAGHQLTGQVRWVQGRRFGLRMSERIDVHAIMSGKPPKKRIKGKKIEVENDPDKWPIEKVVGAYALLGVTAFATAYLLVNYFVL